MSVPDAAADAGDDRDDRIADAADLSVIRPAIERDDVDASGRVGAVAYPYRVYRATATMTRPFVGDRTREYVVSLDRSRRIPLRADAYPETETRTLTDVLVLPAEVTAAEADEMTRDAVFKWTLRTHSLNEAPDIDLLDPIDVYKVFWLAERPDGDAIVDSVRGGERPLDDGPR
ncbi:MAG: hypothetical protein ABEJ77_01555 [Halanaeroarchaeum sp.]